MWGIGTTNEYIYKPQTTQKNAENICIKNFRVFCVFCGKIKKQDNMQQAHNIYLTKFQQQSLYMGAKDERVIAARRVGKTDGLVAPYVWTASNSMPGMLSASVAA